MASSRSVSTAAGEVLGGWGSRSRFISFFSRGICLMTGFGLSYSFTNPDPDTVYEVFPLQNQTKFAFLHLYQVEQSKQKEFEDRIKDLSRFNQKQPGYLYTRLFRLKKDHPSNNPSSSSSSSQSPPSSVGSDEEAISSSSSLPAYDYFQITTWLTVEDFLLARDKPIAQQLRSLLPLSTSYLSSSFLYQNVADDTKYTFNSSSSSS